MVGVPGRSKGCMTCRRRKKGCDKQMPVCNRCVRAGLTCEGYGKDLVWLNSTKTGSPINEPEPLSYSTEISDLRPWMVSYARKKNSEPLITLHNSFVNSAREQLYLGLFWSIMIPNGPQFSVESSDLSSIGWTKYVGELYDSEATLRYATIATAASIVGRANHDIQLRLKGLQVYNWTIQEMVKAIKQPSRATGDGLVAAARVMALYELLFGPDGDPQLSGWQRHSEGQMAMFLTRGPESFVSGASHQLFIDSRINMIMLAIRERTPSPFSGHAWETVPWTVIEKSTKDSLIDIMNYLPDLILTADALKSSDSIEDRKESVEAFFRQCRDMEAALAAWSSQIDLSTYDFTTAGFPLPKPVKDTEFALLHLSCVCWGIYLMLYSVMGSISKLNGHTSIKHEDSPQTISTPTHQAEKNALPFIQGSPYISPSPYIFASKIVHCAHLFFEPSAGIVQGGSGLFPILSALRFYEMNEVPGRSSDEFQMLHGLFHTNFVGGQVGRYLAHLRGDISPEELELIGDGPHAKSREQLRWF